jgi:predicted kinase
MVQCEESLETMEAVIFCGIQATGKSSFFRERFFHSHIRINLDMLRTRHREGLLLRACLEGKQRFVVDNTNPSVADRAPYIAAARAAGFRVVGYYFASHAAEALRRNQARAESERVPDAGLLGTHKRLELPRRDEGFDELYYVRLTDGGFVVEEFCDEIR